MTTPNVHRQVNNNNMLCMQFVLEKMSRKVYIGRLNDQVRERDVDNFFRGFHVRDIMLKNGYGFVVSVR